MNYAGPKYGREEIDAVVRVLENPGQIGAGPAVAEFERAVAALFAKPHGLMVNSGSSANLLALASLDIPAGSEVITPALTFSTTVAPILQLGLRPVFADSCADTHVVDPEAVEAAVTPRTRAIMIPLLLGNVPDMAALRAVCDRHGLAFVEDSCDTLGARFGGMPTGAFSDVSTTSFYATHIITCAGGGGLVSFRDERHAERARLLTYWGRSSVLFRDGSDDFERRYQGGYDAKFVFAAAGYNLQPLELQAAFGLEQLKKLPSFIATRRARWLELLARVSRHADVISTAKGLPGADPVWLAFPLRVLDSAPFTRRDLAAYLEAHDVQTRPIMAGNILRHPGFEGLACPEHFPGADAVMRGGLLIGAHQGMTHYDTRYAGDLVDEFVRRHS